MQMSTATLQCQNATLAVHSRHKIPLLPACSVFLPFRAPSAPPAPRGVLRGVPSLPNSLHSFFSSVRRRCRTGCGATDWTEVYGNLVAEVGSGE